MNFPENKEIFKEIRKYEKTENKRFILELFYKTPNRYHISLLKYMLFIYKDYHLIKDLLTLNIALLSYCCEKNYNLHRYINFNNLMKNKNNIKIVRKKLIEKDINFINLMYLINDEYKRQILYKNKYIFVLINLCEIYSSHIWIKFIKNLDIFLNSINSNNIYKFIHCIFYDKKISLTKKQKNIILFKIYKYIHYNECCITFVENILKKDSYDYRDFILKCSKKSLYIWEFIPLNDYFFLKILNDTNKRQLFHYDDNLIENVSQDNLINNITIYPDLIHSIKMDENILLRIINMNTCNMNVLDFIINEVNNKFEYRFLLKKVSIISRLISIDTCHFFDKIYQYMNLYLSLTTFCRIVKNANCSCVMNLHCHNNLRNRLDNYNYNTIFTFLLSNPIIIKFFDKQELFDKFGISFIKTCLDIDSTLISYFKDDFLPYKESLHINPQILEFITNKNLFIELFIYAMKNINRDYTIFISDYTYEHHFSDVCNAYILFDRLENDIDLFNSIRSHIYKFLL